MDRFEAMSILVTVVDAGSLSAASRKLAIPLATVSRKVNELETHLKTRLLNRTTRQLSLTEAGASYVLSCRRILDELGEAERAATGEYAAPKGSLNVTAPVVLGRLHVVPVLAEFLSLYPEIDVRLFLSDRSINLLEEHVDVAVRVGELPDSSLIAKRVGEIRVVICGSPHYLATHGTPKTPDDLTLHSSINFDGFTSPLAWTFSTGKPLQSVAIRPRLTVNTAEAAIDAAELDVGLTRVLSYQIASSVQEGRLQTVLADYEPTPMPVNLVHAGQTPVPLKLRAFLDFMSPRLEARLSVA